jgi:excinuclease ABC subunit C
MDVFGLARQDDEACVQVFFVRGTKVVGRDHFLLRGVQEETDASVLASFLEQFYESAVYIPRDILLPTTSDETSLIMLWLSGKKGKQVTIAVPQRGERKRLIDLANENAREALQMQRVKWLADRGKTGAALEQLRDELGLDDVPRRIECYDISNTQGTNSVASMVVFIDGHARPSEYRRFKIKTVEGANDFASHAEVMRRRFKRARDASENPDTSEKDRAWGQWPDLVIIDGGKGQLNAAQDAMLDVGAAHVPTVGLAKENEEIFVKDESEPIILPRNSEGLYLVQRIRDEAHRFAITFHRQVRSKQGVKSALDEIRGVGPTRKKALIRKFGSVRGIREATVEEVAATEGFTRTLAEKVKSSL